MPLIPLFVQNEIQATVAAAKRMSAFNFCNSSDHILPIADGTVSAADRHHLWGMYSGILATVGGGIGGPFTVDASDYYNAGSEESDFYNAGSVASEEEV